MHVSRPPVEVPPARITEIDEAIAEHAAAYIGDGSVVQTDVGAVPDALLRLLHDRRDLGVHSGMLGDGLVELIEAGAVTNARKSIDPGVSITGALIGTRRLYEFAHRNPLIRMTPTSYTHDAGALARLDGLVTIDSAMEVDLTGQVNAEQSGTSYVGGTGGQVDFVRAGARSRGGRAITARSDVDVVVTESGAAELKGRGIAERTRRLIAVAHPDFQEDLEREAHTVQRRGF
ncbi:acetyl-CoA hydrolase/transferase family protein [Actinomadura algeriensis]|uniref:Acyl-CoA hydrolase n=1 Tax=Actinomadura algeriensis TaxID=1679523 RepID=A0ABR9JYY9_9ACTN|nr:acetyl-CoA hydrolase/transferase C-terminal domain-containing protein [Actinomadura algeriensis]MBE1535561.1 acyl-CoA hydrolase [Actinomadura algeriensis]